MVNTSELELPHDLAAERALLGVLLLSPAETGEALQALDPSDLYHPAHRAALAAMGRLHREGRNVDAVTIADAMRLDGELEQVGGMSALLDWQAEAPSYGWQSHAEIIVRLSMLRQIIGISSEAISDARYGEAGPADLRDRMVARLTEVADVIREDLPIDGLLSWIEASSDDTPPPPWVIPGIIRQGHRAIVVAPEGAGKSVFIRCLAIAASFGRHPFEVELGRRRIIDPVPTLTVDLENPSDQIASVGRMILRALRAEGVDTTESPAPAFVLSRPEGMDLRTRRARIELERAIARTRPRLVAFGPIYKAVYPERGESDEQVSKEVMAVLDDLRTRYDFALVMEHHAAKPAAGARRALSPIGSSIWLRWPELGRSLEPLNGGLASMEVGKWRGDRIEVRWPKQINRGKVWPFDGVYDDPPPPEF